MLFWRCKDVISVEFTATPAIAMIPESCGYPLRPISIFIHFLVYVYVLFESF